MTEYNETLTDPEDVESNVLAALAKGHPYVFIVAKIDDELEVDLSVGGGISNRNTIRTILNKTLDALPT